LSFLGRALKASTRCFVSVHRHLSPANGPVFSQSACDSEGWRGLLTRINGGPEYGQMRIPADEALSLAIRNHNPPELHVYGATMLEKSRGGGLVGRCLPSGEREPTTALSGRSEVRAVWTDAGGSGSSPYFPPIHSGLSVYFPPIDRIEVGKSLQMVAAPVRPCPLLAGQISCAGRDMSGHSNQWSRMGDTGSTRRTCQCLRAFSRGDSPRIPLISAKRPHVFP
jgi:hypothetical protein